jgi:membrane protein implicated in regulation of membrane protease activity
MLELFWGAFAFGIMFAVVTVILGDLISQALDGMLDFLSVDYLDPMVVATGITGFGGAGILLSKYTAWGAFVVLTVSLLIAVLLSALIYFAYVKPVKNSENSIGYSMADFSGKIGEVTVTIPERGYGEVLIKAGAGNTNQIAASFEGVEIQTGTRVVVVEVKEGTLYVSRFETK